MDIVGLWWWAPTTIQASLSWHGAWRGILNMLVGVIRFCVYSTSFWDCKWNALSNTVYDKALNKIFFLPSFLFPPNSLRRLVQKFQPLILNSIQSASWTLLPTSWRNLSCYIGQTQDLGTTAVATSVRKKRNSEKRSSCRKQPLCLHLLAKMTEVGWNTRFNSCLIFPA